MHLKCKGHLGSFGPRSALPSLFCPGTWDMTDCRRLHAVASRNFSTYRIYVYSTIVSTFYGSCIYVCYIYT